MNFSAFLTWREQCLLANPNMLDCAETNLYRSLEALQTKPNTKSPDSQLHRCDLARAWLARYGYPANLSRYALVCRGVRHALALILKELARNHTTLWIPRDIYPVYRELAQAAGIPHRCFTTLPEPEIPVDKPDGCAEYLLITNPWKLLGRYLTNKEVAALESWLEASPHRCLLIDCVYDLEAPLHVTTRTLQKTGRAILLHSATKGWLWPKTFGVAFIGENHSSFLSVFRNDPPTPEQLSLAKQFLSTAADGPSQVSAALKGRAKALFARLPDLVRKSLLINTDDLSQGCYFFPVNIGTEELLKRHQLLSIPPSVFGSDWNGSILTSLAPAFSPANNGKDNVDL